ncbi:hypothetical protein CA607_05245 [Caulobacter vibrioides]|nr:hypothetical protein CA607_05245 [Caulobacter vibrioides]
MRALERASKDARRQGLTRVGGSLHHPSRNPTLPAKAGIQIEPTDAPSVSLRIRSDPPPPQAGQERSRFLLTRIAGEVARR